MVKSWWIVVDCGGLVAQTWWLEDTFFDCESVPLFRKLFLRLSNFPAADLSAGIEAAFRVLLDRGNGRLREA
jgi:hypothetical protein